jgi:hypothetical protein
MQSVVRRIRTIGNFENAGGMTAQQAPIGTPFLLAARANNVTTLTTTRDVPAGSLVVLEIGAFTTPSVSLLPATVTDNAGNTFVFAVEDSVSYADTLWSCLNVNHMPVGTVITFSGSQSVSISAVAVSGANGGLDKTNHTGNGSAVTSTSFSTGALSSNNEIVFCGINDTNGLGTWTEGAGFTPLGSGSGGRPPSYQIVNSTAPVTWAPSWTTATDYSAVIASFKAG